MAIEYIKSKDPESLARNVEEERRLAREAVEAAQKAEDVKTEIRKYATAVALFKQYEKGNTLRDMWEDAHTKGFEYWKSQSIAAAETEDISKVAEEAKQGYSDAIKGERSSANLALGLGRAMTRFKLVNTFKPDVVPLVVAAGEKLTKDSEPWSLVQAECITKQAFAEMDKSFANQESGGEGEHAAQQGVQQDISVEAPLESASAKQTEPLVPSPLAELTVRAAPSPTDLCGEGGCFNCCPSASNS